MLTTIRGHNNTVPFFPPKIKTVFLTSDWNSCFTNSPSKFEKTVSRLKG